MVDVFIIGAPKTGTSSLCMQLQQHSMISYGKKKEPRFFTSMMYEKGIEYYHSLYNGAIGSVLVDGSTSYSEAWQGNCRTAAERIHGYNRDAKIVYSVRCPVERLVSEWRQVRWLISNGHPWIKRITGMEKCTSLENDIKKYPGFVETSNYWKQISEYRLFFDDSRILVLFLEDLIEDASLNYRRVLEFLDLDYEPIQNPERKANVGWQKGEARFLVKLLRRVPGYLPLAKATPDSLKRLLSPLIKHDPDRAIDRTPGFCSFVEEQLREDTEAFLEWQNRAGTFYSFDDESSTS